MKQDNYPAQNMYPNVFHSPYHKFPQVNKHNVYQNNIAPQRGPHFYMQGGVPRFEVPNREGGYEQSISSAMENYIFGMPRPQ